MENPTPESLLRDWYQRSLRSQQAHYQSAVVLSKRHLWLGIPVIVLSSIVATSVFASLDKEQLALWGRISLGTLSVLAAVLASLQTFLRFSERAEKHRSCGARYGALRREIEELLTFRQSTDTDDVRTYKELRNKMDSLASESPEISQRVWDYIEHKYS